MASFINKLLGKDQVRNLRESVRQLERQVENAQLLAAKSLVRQNRAFTTPVPLAQTEFKVFSQFGDDGIIQYVIHRLALPPEEWRFVEFGVEGYREANTRFLLINDNWSGLIMDGSTEHMAAARRDDIFWRHDLTANAHFITRENIDGLLRDAGFTGRIGLLSIDIDGNDYWVWQAITAADPALVIVEYNGIFGAKEAVTVPYDAGFLRSKAHYSHLYSGASLAAFRHLAVKKGYVWIGSNSAGNNAYFVRREYAPLFYPVELPRDFVEAKFREGRNADGALTFTGQVAGREQLRDLPVHDVIEGHVRTMASLNY